jgi:hypothetical protein
MIYSCKDKGFLNNMQYLKIMVLQEKVCDKKYL